MINISRCVACSQPKDEFEQSAIASPNPYIDRSFHDLSLEADDRKNEPPTSNQCFTWRCPHCTMSNSQLLSYCETCLRPNKNQPKNPTTHTSYSEEDGWECTLCLMTNHAHIPYCEECLIPRDVQKNATLLKQLQTKLKSNIAESYNISKLFEYFQLNYALQHNNNWTNCVRFEKGISSIRNMSHVESKLNIFI
eukprot:404998_1